MAINGKYESTIPQNIEFRSKNHHHILFRFFYLKAGQALETIDLFHLSKRHRTYP